MTVCPNCTEPVTECLEICFMHVMSFSFGNGLFDLTGSRGISGLLVNTVVVRIRPGEVFFEVVQPEAIVDALLQESAGVFGPLKEQDII